MHAIKVGATLFLLVTLVCLFVLPAFDLDPTALRASQHAARIFWAIAASAAVLTARSSGAEPENFAETAARQATSNVISLTCNRLC